MDDHVSFKHPPVVETVLGVQFERLTGFSNAHLGRFWQTLGPAEWPNVNDAPPIAEQIERFDKLFPLNLLGFALTQDLSARLQIRNLAQDRMVQVQNCRLDYNWLGQTGAEYPRYSRIKPEFDRILGNFTDFLQTSGWEGLNPSQWEITYVNHLLRGTVWRELGDWAKALNFLGRPAWLPAEIRDESFAGTWHYEIHPQRGRLHVEVQHGRVGSPEGPEALIMKLTSRGRLAEGPDLQSRVDAGLNLGRKVIVEAFRDLTSSEAHTYWNREEP